MKKLLLILPLSLFMSLAWSQTTKDKTNYTSSTVLDGKSYKITLTSADMNKGVSSNSLDKSSMGNDVDKATSVGTDNPTNDQSNTGHSNATHMDNTTTTVSPENNMSNQDKTDKMQATTSTQNHDKEMRDMYENKTFIIRFENNMIHSSFLSSKQVENCPYTITSSNTNATGSTVNASSTNMISFKSTCKQNASAVSKAVYTWTGTVDDKSISGYINTMRDDGKVISYTFTGTETKEKDISKEMGLK